MNKNHALWGACLLGGVLAILPMMADRYVINLMTEMLIYGLFALSFNLLLGYGGMVSFGHAAYFSIGAYACAILLTRFGMPLAMAFPSTIFIVALASALIGYFCVKLTEIYFSMLTLAFGQLVWAIAFKWTSMTGGDTGLIGVAVPEFLQDPNQFYVFTLVVVAIGAILLRLIVTSAYGITLVATRENRNRAEFIGVNVRRVQLLAFVLAGTFAGVAGALLALFNRSVFVETAWWAASAQVMIMSILGGIGSFVGPAVGSATLIGLNRLTEELTVYWPTVLGIVLLCVLFFFPEGLMGFMHKKSKPRKGANDHA